MLVSLVISCYNEEESLPQLFLEIDEILNKHDFNTEVLLIDDGSSDNTARIIEEKSCDRNNVYRSIVFKRNHGQTAAMLAGID